MYLQKVGGITRKRFVAGEEMVVDILKHRLKGERDVSIRRAIRQKLKAFV